MDITALIPGTLVSPSDLTAMRSELASLQKQFVSGKKADTYGGLGDLRLQSLSMRGQIADIGGWQQTISQLGTRLGLMDKSLGLMVDMAMEAKKAITLDNFKSIGPQTQGQIVVKDKLEQTVALLNGQINGRYMFAGRQTDSQPVLAPSDFMGGVDGKDGFKAVHIQRRHADLGGDLSVTSGPNAPRGRLTDVTKPTTTQVSVNEDGTPQMPFGMKFDVGPRPATGSPSGLPKTLTGTLSGVAAKLDMAGGNLALTIDVTSNPQPGQTLDIGLTLPDGTRTRISLEALTSTTGSTNAGAFAIGATPADTATNIQNALKTALDKTVRTELMAASAAQAGSDFFEGKGGYAVRVVPAAGAAPASYYTATATSDMSATTANTNGSTVRWYVGDTLSTDPRATASTSVDQGVTLSYGARADEAGTRLAVQNLAVIATMDINIMSPQANDMMAAYQKRIADGLSQEKTVATLSTMRMELASVNATAKNIDDKHKQSKAMAETILDDTEGVNRETVAAQMLALNQRMEASFMTTTRLAKLTLVDYIK